MKVTAHSAFASRFFAWVQERFPLANAILFLVLYAAALLFGRASAAGGSIDLTPLDVFGFLAVWGFFLVLRVFDEHKDFALDARNHPHRVLQSGLVTLAHLKVAGVLAAALGLAVSLAYDHGIGRVTLAWAAMMGWSALMAKEFFVGEWLGKRIVLYAFTHMLVMPLALLWMAQMGAGGAPLPRATISLAAMAFFSGFAFEIARKTKAPADEQDGVDSYTKALGLRGAPAALAFTLLASTASLVWTAAAFQGDGRPPIGACVAAGAGLALPLAAVAAFVLRPSKKASKKIEASVGIAMLVAYGTLVVSLAMLGGVRWR